MRAPGTRSMFFICICICILRDYIAYKAPNSRAN